MTVFEYVRHYGPVILLLCMTTSKTGLSVFIIFLLIGLLSIRANAKPKARRYARPKGRHYEGRGLWIRLYRYASQLVRSLLPD